MAVVTFKDRKDILQAGLNGAHNNNNNGHNESNQINAQPTRTNSFPGGAGEV